MTRMQKWSLLTLFGVAVMLGGLVWDAFIHATEHAHLVVEALFNPTSPFENPAHAAIGIGLAWTTVTALGAFTTSWLEDKGSFRRWQSLTVPAALWTAMGVAGVVALVFLAQTP